jgi:hypothetical protein
MLVSLNIIAALGLFMIVGGTYATAELIKEAYATGYLGKLHSEFQHPFVTRNRDCLKALALGAAM